MARPRQHRKPAPAPARTGKLPIWPWVLAIASLVLIVGAVIVGTQPSQSASERQPESGQESSAEEMTFDVARRAEGDVTAMGDVDAPVVIVEYSDYRCPFCAVVSRDTMPQIIENYVETGKIRFEWRDFPIFGEESELAAIAGRAAGEQGKFWEFNEAVYAEAPARSHIDLPRERLIEFAKQVGVPDIDQFTADLENDELRAAVQKDAEEAQSIGVSSTPIFIVGNTPLVGAQPYEAFEQTIESELAAAEGK